MSCSPFFLRVPAFVRLAALGACALALALGGAAARAGTVTIQQTDGSTQTYSDVVVKVIHNILYVSSADGKGTMIISRAACAYQGQILVCLPTAMTLSQNGAVNPIKLRKGTLYVNLTDQTQQLAASTMKMSPHSIILSMETKVGTYVNVSGAIDKVTP